LKKNLLHICFILLTASFFACGGDSPGAFSANNTDSNTDLVTAGDAVCGDGQCTLGEDCSVCATDCSCGSNEICTEGFCLDPAASACGDGICDASTEDCRCADCACSDRMECFSGTCVEPAEDNDGKCEKERGENCGSSPSDCGCDAGDGYQCVDKQCQKTRDGEGHCGDGQCDESAGEDCSWCASDCGCNGLECINKTCQVPDRQDERDSDPNDGNWISENSCKDRCNKEFDKNANCQCDSFCKNQGDCCNDIEDKCGEDAGSYQPKTTCENRCGDYDQDDACQCDSECGSNGDCCSDLQEQCKTNEAAGSCDARCGDYDIMAGCQCDDACVGFDGADGCCSDYATKCEEQVETCSGRCGEMDSNTTCQCDPDCVDPNLDGDTSDRDCCNDYAGECLVAPSGSCGGGRCGEFDYNAGCQCDPDCSIYGGQYGCCTDYQDVCVESGGSTVSNSCEDRGCDSYDDNASCNCDAYCSDPENDDCCADYSEVCSEPDVYVSSSCFVRGCNSYELGATCNCDEYCDDPNGDGDTEDADCCSDYTGTCGGSFNSVSDSCYDRGCDSYEEGASCNCDAYCSDPENNDCCNDYNTFCGDPYYPSSNSCWERGCDSYEDGASCNCDYDCVDPDGDPETNDSDCCYDYNDACYF
jgi:hypothetical protein